MPNRLPRRYCKKCLNKIWCVKLQIREIIIQDTMVIGLMQDELGRKLLAKFATLQRKTMSYLINQKKKKVR